MEDKFNDMHFITIILKKVFNYINYVIGQSVMNKTDMILALTDLTV